MEDPTSGIPLPDAYLDSTFGEEGYLARAFPGYKPRKGQVALARAVDSALVSGSHLLAEGSTGIGKSVAYSVPATYFAWKNQCHVVIVTANNTLSEQLVTKDLPMLRSILPWPFTFGMLKGRNNFVCELKRLDFEADRATNRTLPGILSDEKQVNLVADWARDSAQIGPGKEEGRTGDISELPFEPEHNLWRRFSVSSDECRKGRCEYKAQCFANHAIAKAREARVIVTNYHMLFSHLRVFQSTGMDLVLPTFRVAILDEAHKAPGIARDFFGFRITQEAVRRLARKVRFDQPLLTDRVERASVHFFHAMSELKQDRRRYKARLDADCHGGEEDVAWNELRPALDELCGTLESDVLEWNDRYVQDKSKVNRDGVAEAEAAHKRGNEIFAGLSAAMSNSDPRNVYFLDVDEKQRVGVCSKLVRPGDALRSALFERHTTDEQGNARSVSIISTSATLSTGSSFEYIANELGVPAGYQGLVAPSPFDWENQAIFVVPDRLPEPNDKGFPAAVCKNMETIVLLAGGRTLGLFTSRKMLETVYDALVLPCARNKLRLLKQGSAPRSKLISEFKKDVSSVLLGTESFWAGVDVPGEACSVVVIDRLPFPSPDDPVMDVLSQHDEKAFWKYAIPSAIIQFKQGVGRLIRSSKCHGVIVCLDNRLRSKRYGKEFLRALPPVRKSTQLSSIAEWLGPLKTGSE